MKNKYFVSLLSLAFISLLPIFVFSAIPDFDSSNPYKILGVTPDMTPSQIDAQKNMLMLMYRTSNQNNLSEEGVKNQAIVTKIETAYKAIKPQKPLRESILTTDPKTLRGSSRYQPLYPSQSPDHESLLKPRDFLPASRDLIPANKQNTATTPAFKETISNTLEKYEDLLRDPYQKVRSQESPYSSYTDEQYDFATLSSNSTKPNPFSTEAREFLARIYQTNVDLRLRLIREVEQERAQEQQVDKPLAILPVELSVIAEPKALLPSELKKLVAQHGGYRQVANAIGVSEAFIRQNVNIRKSKKS